MRGFENAAAGVHLPASEPVRGVMQTVQRAEIRGAICALTGMPALSFKY